MPGWDIFPYEVGSLRLKPLQPPAAAEPERRGEDAAECWCARVPTEVLRANGRPIAEALLAAQGGQVGPAGLSSRATRRAM